MNTAADLPTLRLIANGEIASGDLMLTGGFNFLVSLDFGDGKEVRVPIENEHLVIEKATVSGDFHLHRAAAQN